MKEKMKSVLEWALLVLVVVAAIVAVYLEVVQQQRISLWANKLVKRLDRLDEAQTAKVEAEAEAEAASRMACSILEQVKLRRSETELDAEQSNQPDDHQWHADTTYGLTLEIPYGELSGDAGYCVRVRFPWTVDAGCHSQIQIEVKIDDGPTYCGIYDFVAVDDLALVEGDDILYGDSFFIGDEGLELDFYTSATHARQEEFEYQSARHDANKIQKANIVMYDCFGEMVPDRTKKDNPPDNPPAPKKPTTKSASRTSRTISNLATTLPPKPQAAPSDN